MITVIKAPQLYTTLNLAHFQLSSNRPTILKFNVSVVDAATDSVLGVQGYGTLPMFQNGTSFNLAPVLSSFVSTQLVNTTTLLEATPKITRAYKLIVQERYIDGTGQSVLGDSLTTGVYNIVNAELSRYQFSAFDYRSLVAGAGLSTTRFLSNRPLVSNLSYGTKEFLSFVTSTAARVKLTFYAKDGVLAGTQYIPVEATDKAYRLNLSPKDIDKVYGENLLSFYGKEFSEAFSIQFGNSSSILSANYFTVQIVHVANDTALSETRTYVLKNESCKKKQAQILFTNNLGGFDSAMFFEPRQTISSSKTMIDSNPFQYDATGNYSDIQAGVFNPDKRVISSETSSTFSIVSDPLSDELSRFYRGIFESEEVYVKLDGDILYPIIIEQTPYGISQRKYSTSNNRLELSFKVDGINFSLT